MLVLVLVASVVDEVAAFSGALSVNVPPLLQPAIIVSSSALAIALQQLVDTQTAEVRRKAFRDGVCIGAVGSVNAIAT